MSVGKKRDAYGEPRRNGKTQSVFYGLLLEGKM